MLFKILYVALSAGALGLLLFEAPSGALLTGAPESGKVKLAKAKPNAAGTTTSSPGGIGPGGAIALWAFVAGNQRRLPGRKVMSTLPTMLSSTMPLLAADKMVDVGAILQALIYSAIGIALFGLAFFVIVKIAPFSIRKEIEDDQNTSLGIIIGSVILGISLIISAAVQG